jgi:hypothetical protein
LHAKFERMEWQQRFLLAGAASAVLTGLVAVLRFLHDMHVIGPR